METQYDHKQFAILYVDDEELSLKNFARAFGDEFRIYTATNARDGLKLIEEKKGEIGILMTDQKMPGEKGTWLLERARQIEPRIIRILVTAHTDFHDAIEAINTGAIYHYINKPWVPEQLEVTLRQAMDFFIVQRERDRLLEEKMEALRKLMVADRLVSLGMLTAGLSHHIRNALVTVKTFMDLAPAKMREEKADAAIVRNPDFWSDYHQSVLIQIDRINNLLKELWVASEKSSGELADSVKLHALVAETVENLKDALAAKNLQVENQLAPELPALQVEKSRFQRLFELLLKEELASLPAGSQITFRAREVVVSGGRTEIQLQIGDNGPGLLPETAQHLFDPFMVRSDTPSEHGIHLMACFFIVHQHGGRIEAASQPGHGTTFTLHFPIHPDRSTRGLSQDPLQKSRLGEQLWGGVR
jgi:two-component system, probable response regulator PhcQ